jgi:hypothetical protein
MGTPTRTELLEENIALRETLDAATRAHESGDTDTLDELLLGDGCGADESDSDDDEEG